MKCELVIFFNKKKEKKRKEKKKEKKRKKEKKIKKKPKAFFELRIMLSKNEGFLLNNSVSMESASRLHSLVTKWYPNFQIVGIKMQQSEGPGNQGPMAMAHFMACGPSDKP